MSTTCAQCHTGIYRYPQPGNPEQWVHFDKPADGHFARPDTSDRDRAVFELMQEITRYGERIAEACDTYEQSVNNVKAVLDTDDPFRGTWTYTNVEDPARLLNDMRPLCKIAQQLGVPDDLICQARRGEYVAHYAVRAASERRIEPELSGGDDATEAGAR